MNDELKITKKIDATLEKRLPHCGVRYATRELGGTQMN